jgi:hypothetical protein
MKYEDIAIKDDEVPNASSRIFQHLVKTYASEVNKLNSVWHGFAEQDLAFKPHPRASTVGQIIEHELLSERRFWIFWRRVLHTAHHRAQLGVYLRMLDKSVPSIYGPTADVRWEGADPTSSVAAASRK